MRWGAMRSILFLLVFVGCGGGADDDDGGNPEDPKLVSGGGVTGPTIDGRVHVHVIAADTGSPLSGATVHIGADARTDSTGLATFPDVSGPQTISAAASGYAAATWIGVAGTNVTIPLQPSAAVPTAHTSGTLQLPGPSGGSNYTLAVVLYSFLDDPSARENAISQPTNGMGVPLNACVNSGGTPSCTWQLTTRIGKQILTAVVVNGFLNNLGDPDDDTYTFKSYAVSSPMTLTAGQQVTNVSLTPVTATSQLTVNIPPAPPGLGNVVAIPELALGDVGRIVFPLPTLKQSGTARVIANTGQFAGNYEVVGLATPSATAKAPFSSTFAHNVSGTATLEPWLAAPAPQHNAGTFTFGAVSGASFYTAQFTRGDTTLWNVTVLDGSTSFKLPALQPDPLGTGTVTFSIGAAVVPSFDPKEFTIPNVTTTLTRASGGQGSFTR